jgi:hypothetical protein
MMFLILFLIHIVIIYYDLMGLCSDYHEKISENHDVSHLMSKLMIWNQIVEQKYIQK